VGRGASVHWHCGGAAAGSGNGTIDDEPALPAEAPLTDERVEASGGRRDTSVGLHDARRCVTVRVWDGGEVRQGVRPRRRRPTPTGRRRDAGRLPEPPAPPPVASAMPSRPHAQRNRSASLRSTVSWETTPCGD